MNYKKIIKNSIHFYNAVLSDNYNKAKKILKRDFKINEATCHEIFSKGNLKYFNLILESDKNIAAIHNNLPIKLAAKYGHIEMVTLLLKEKNIEISPLMNSSLGIASISGHFEIVELLLKDNRLKVPNFHNNILQDTFNNGHINIAYALWKNLKIRKYTRTLSNSINLSIKERKLLEQIELFKIQDKLENFS